MKKALFIIACVLGIITGALLIWKVVIPIIGFSWKVSLAFSLY